MLQGIRWTVSTWVEGGQVYLAEFYLVEADRSITLHQSFRLLRCLFLFETGVWGRDCTGFCRAWGPHTPSRHVRISDA